MNQTQINLTELDSIDDLLKLKDLLRYEKMFLDFSYYSGFIIAAFNFNIFVLAAIIYSQVGCDFILKENSISIFFKEKVPKNLVDVYRKPSFIRHYSAIR